MLFLSQLSIASELARTATLGAFITATAGTQAINVSFDQPTLDQWNYPFAGSPGGSQYAAVFGGITSAGFDPNFDNRDSQLLIGFQTDPQVPTGLSPWQYTVQSARVRITVETNQTFNYDPTPDSYRSWLPPDDPEYQPDTDPGRPVDLFGTGFRWGFSANTYSENTSYSPAGPIGRSIRTAYPVTFVAGQCVDASNNVAERFDPVPFAVGMNTSLAHGQAVPVNTVLEFEINVADADIQRYLQRALREGMLDFSVASIFQAEQQQFGGYPRFYTKEHKLVLANLVSAARLDMVVNVSDTPVPAGDVNGDAVVNVADLLAVINAWGPCHCCAADVTFDNVVNVEDLLMIINTWG